MDCTITGIISLISAITGFIAIIIAVYQLNGLKKSINNASLMSNFNIEFELNKRKQRLADIRVKVFELIDGRSRSELSDKEKSLIKILDSHQKEAFEDYLNAFDRLAYFILNNKLNEEDFRLDYREMLADTIENDEQDFFKIGTRYRNMVKLNGQWKDK
ncbi:hypothetical protein QJU89_02370 [Pasteurella skyensis]|uniref:DUF4760 domain-containing protein n=1 Tax=Phocoenobacter skyensis TaxID=97481 RepID=A0AAJ6N8S3_9PAST|nr:hypothetical protein [Pasteurella skyensis]MDP8162381.1 hypothetical protein [Pasteurella skyensis]MDP8172285.1 hypothetical protein [Pasteurella skyensis]MDP8178540.1 hypothetical protein [Pasteurella skyensis]MDP8182542.1 hypothetical protein [Pasteurella skyensis]MDP8188847.1 hypothetical protein [Pasteurella skyensis]